MRAMCIPLSEQTHLKFEKENSKSTFLQISVSYQCQAPHRANHPTPLDKYWYRVA